MQQGSCNSAQIDVTDECFYYYYYTVQNYSDATMQVHKSCLKLFLNKY